MNINAINGSKSVYYTSTVKKTPSFKENESDKLVAQNSSDKKKNNNIWKWLFGAAVVAGLVAVAFVEHKVEKLEEAREKAIKEGDEKLKKELEALEKKKEEEIKKWVEEWEKLINKLTPPPSTSEKTSSSGQKTTSTVYKTSKIAEKSSPQNNTVKVSENTSNQITQEKMDEVKELLEKTRIVQEETKRIDNMKFKLAFLSELGKLNKEPGIEKVIGYKKEKNFIINKLMTPIIEKREKEIPNMLILYGPKGTGKTFVADAFIEGPIFNVVNLTPTLKPQKDLEILNTALKQAEENYQKTGKWTFIRIDEIDGFINSKNKEIVESYKNIVENLTQNHATIFATTNHPQEINSAIFNAEKCEKLYFPPIRNEDLPALIEHYAKNFADNSINYNELAQIIINKSKGEAYTNARISCCIKEKVSGINNIRDEETPVRLLNQQDLKEAFEDSLPDISKKTLDYYKTIIEKF